MNLLIGVASECLAAILFGVLLLGCRKPEPPMWAPDLLVDAVYLPLLVGLLVMGVCFLTQAPSTFGAVTDGWLEIAISLAMILFSVALMSFMRIREKLARYEALRAEAERKASILPFSPEAPQPDSTKPAPSRPKRLAAC